MSAPPITRDLFVSDLAFEVKEEDLRKLFAVCGRVSSVRLLNDRRSGQFQGCALIHMASAAEAKDALQSLDGARLLGRCIRVQPARPKNAAPPIAEDRPARPRRPRGRRR